MSRSRKKVDNPLQGSFDFVFDTEEEKQVAQHAQTVELITDGLFNNPIQEVDEIQEVFDDIPLSNVPIVDETQEVVNSAITTSNNTNVEEVAKVPYTAVLNTEDLNDSKFLFSTWVKDNLTAIKIAQKNHADITTEEKHLLMKYHGWGGLPSVFDEKRYPDGTYAEAREELKSLLTDSEYRNVMSSTLTAMYTPTPMVNILQNGLAKLGVFDNATKKRGIKVLDPAAGTGRMLYNLVNIEPRLVELDPVTAKISTALFGPSRVINTGFEKSGVNDGSVDVVIANPPFGDFKVGDNKLGASSIHNYFMKKSIDSLKEGGVGAFIVSRHFMDSKNSASREYIAEKANLIGAYRLPAGMFPDTKVVVDVLFFEKTSNNLNKNWVNSKTVSAVENFIYYQPELVDNITINEFYINNPKNILGLLTPHSNQYGEREILPALKGVIHKGDVLDDDVLQQRIFYDEDGNGFYDIPPSKVYDTLNNDINNNFKKLENFHTVDTSNTSVFGNKNTPLTDDKSKDFDLLSTVYSDLINLEKDPNSTYAQLVEKRELLNIRYKSVVAKYGYLSDKSNKPTITNSSSSNLLALEDVKQQSRGKVTAVTLHKIFKERVYHPVKWNIQTPDDALLYSLNTTGGIDIKLMTEKLNCEEKDILTPLLDQQKIFYDPENEQYELAARYLSGNVVEKLEYAAKAGLTKNVEALSAIQPVLIPFEQIPLSISTPWMPPETLKKFAKDNFNNMSIDVDYDKILGQWTVTCPRYGASTYVRQNYTTSRVDFKTMLENTIIGKSISIYDDTLIDGVSKRVLNPEETKKAQDCQKALQQLFEEWVQTIPIEDQRTLEGIYNKRFNNIVLPKYDGSLYKFSSDLSTKPLYPHQKNAVARSLLEGKALYDHVVGAGKTRVMITTLLEGKRLGLWQKPIVVVPNHLIGQWGKETREDYPGSNICLATIEDMSSKNRQEFLSQIMSNDYDLIVMGHSHFKHIGLDPKKYEEFIENQILDLEASMENSPSPATVKQQQRALKILQSRLEAQVEKNKKNTGAITIDELGIDAIAVDEAHLFKNLAYTTNKNIAGLNDPNGSQRATDLLLKMNYIQEKYGRGTFLATGTPFSNSLSEIFVMQKYLDNDNLQKQGIATFDAWVDTFGKVTKNWEISSSGQGFQMKERLASFNACPELAKLYRSFADVFTTEDLKQVGQIKIPTVNYIKDVSKPSPIQQEHFEVIIDRVTKIQNGIDPRIDNMLKLTSFAKNSALDPRIIDSTYEDFQDSKVNNLVRNVTKLHAESKETLGTQVIFCDSSTPKESSKLSRQTTTNTKKSEDGLEDGAITTSEFDAEDGITSEIDTLAQGDSRFTIYDDIREKLIKNGIEPKEIAFIHDYKTDKQKQQLYQQVNNGEVRVILGSTSKLGAGTNMQQKLIGLHHLDVPWRPSDLIQREGRIIRQGNQNETVNIYRYITEGTYDARSWQIIENKAKIAQQFTSAMNSNERKIADVGMQTMNAAELKASATGNPYALYYVMIDQELDDIKRSHRSFENQKRTAEKFLETHTHESINLLKYKQMSVIKEFEEIRDNTEPLNITDADNEKLKFNLKTNPNLRENKPFLFANYRDVKIEFNPSTSEFMLYSPDNWGTLNRERQYPIRDISLHYFQSELAKFSPRALFKKVDHILENKLPKMIENIEQQYQNNMSDITKFNEFANKEFPQKSKMSLLENDLKHCSYVMNRIQADPEYSENWIPLSIKDQIKEDLLPKGYQPELNNPNQNIDKNSNKLFKSPEEVNTSDRVIFVSY